MTVITDAGHPPGPVQGGVRVLRPRPSAAMPLRRKEVELAVERPLGLSDAPGAMVRLTARFEQSMHECNETCIQVARFNTDRPKQFPMI